MTNNAGSSAGGIYYDSDIFQGKRFWLSQRLPLRGWHEDLLKTHGGVVVPLERDADFLIADPKRKDAPPGSLSYDFIKHSVEHSALQLEDRYLIGPNPDIPRPAGSSILRKRKRTPFTSHDDALLAQCVLSHPNHRRGRAIYQEFEAKYPHHTWQSWKDRWVKVLELLPNDRLRRMAASVPAENGDTAAENAPDVPIHSTPSAAPPASREAVQPPPREAPPVTRKASPVPRDVRPVAPQVSAAEADVTAINSAAEDQPEQVPENDLDTQDKDQEVADDDEEDMRRHQFYEDLTEFHRNNGDETNPSPVIGNKTVDLFDLAMAVGSQDMPPDDIDWQLVASDLHFDPEDIARVAPYLEICWSENLGDFLREMAEKEGNMDDDEETGQDNGYGQAAEQSSAISHASPGPNAQMATPKRSSPRKRALEPTSASPLPSVSKRRKFNVDADFASSPDETPSTTRKQVARHAEMSLFVGDSQDDTGDLPAHGRSYDVTPSQQLRSETRLHSDGANDWEAHQEQPSPTNRARDLIASTSPSTQAHLKKPTRRPLPWISPNNAHSRQDPPHDAATSSDTDDPANDSTVQRPRRDSPDYDTIEGWIEHYQTMGYQLPVVLDALRATSLTPGGPASHAMESLRSGKGLPGNYSGVWTDRDDTAMRRIIAAQGHGELSREPLDSADRRPLRTARADHARLVYKHGEESVALRGEFLEALDQESRV